MFGITLLLASFIQAAEAAPPRAPSSTQHTAVPTTPCQIPIYVNLEGVPEELYSLYTKSIWEAAYTWNTSDAGFWFEVKDWNYPEDRRDGAVTVSFTEIDPVNNKVIGFTHRLADDDGHTVRRARVQINSTDRYCTKQGEVGCYQMFNVVLHELGHALSLPHTDVTGSVMSFGVGMSEEKKALTSSEIEALRVIFPADGSGCSGREESFAWSKRQ